MDALAGFLDGPRARGAFLLRTVLEPPWSLRIQDEAPLTVLAVVSGSAWIEHDGLRPQRIGEGDVALIRGPEPYTVADEVGRAPQVVIHPGQRCTTPDGVDVSDEMTLGVRTWGNDAGGATTMMTGIYQAAGEISHRLIDALPQLIVLDAETWDSPVVPLLADEVGRDEVGQEVVLDRLLDLLVVSALRTWFARPEVKAPRWYSAHTDEVVGKALRLMQHNVAEPWTVESLARATGTSRAAFARRFTEHVGEPPMTYLSGFRLALACDLLVEQGSGVAAVGRTVGYDSPFTFSTAFKRQYGMSPRAYRDQRMSEPLAR